MKAAKGKDQHSTLKAVFRKAKKNNSNGIVCALQPRSTRTRLHMDEVIGEALNFGFKVFLYFVEPGYASRGGKNYQHVNSDLQGKFGVDCVQLDGRRFAHINSTIINTNSPIAF